jgi:predicted transcriptional regulator
MRTLTEINQDIDKADAAMFAATTKSELDEKSAVLQVFIDELAVAYPHWQAQNNQANKPGVP